MFSAAVKFMETNIVTTIVVSSLLLYIPIAYLVFGRPVCAQLNSTFTSLLKLLIYG